MARPAPRSVALGASVVLIVLLTLVPFPGEEPLAPCWACGSEPTADVVRNVGAFVPLGLALAAHGLPVVRAGLVATAASAGIEAVQRWLPGRRTSAADVVANGAGTALGALAWWRRRRPRSSRRLVLCTGVSTLCLLAPVWLFASAPGALPLFGHWTPDFGHRARYPGRIHGARVGDAPIPDGGAAGRPEALRRALRADRPIRVRFEPARPGPGIAPLIAVSDARQREILAVEAVGERLRIRRRTRARDWGFDQPDRLSEPILPAAGVGPPVRELRILQDGGEVCLGLDGREECGLGLGVGEGYGLVYWGGPRPRWLRWAQALLWLGLLGALAGAAAPGRRSAGLAAGLLLGGALLAPWLGPLQPASLLELAALPVGVALGYALGPRPFGPARGPGAEAPSAQAAGRIR